MLQIRIHTPLGFFYMPLFLFYMPLLILFYAADSFYMPLLILFLMRLILRSDGGSVAFFPIFATNPPYHRRFSSR